MSEHTEILGVPNFHIFPIVGKNYLNKEQDWEELKKKPNLPVDQE